MLERTVFLSFDKIGTITEVQRIFSSLVSTEAVTHSSEGLSRIIFESETVIEETISDESIFLDTAVSLSVDCPQDTSKTERMNIFIVVVKMAGNVWRLMAVFACPSYTFER